MIDELCDDKSEHITPVLYSLHWLPVEYRITFKVLLLTFKILNNYCPKYLKELVNLYEPARALRSADKMLLTVPSTRCKSYGDRSFSFVAAKTWNSLPMNVRSSSSLECFKNSLKTFLFKKAYNC